MGGSIDLIDVLDRFSFMNERLTCLKGLHVSQIACSQQGNRNAFTASLPQMAHRNLMGMSSGDKELRGAVSVAELGDLTLKPSPSYLISSA